MIARSDSASAVGPAWASAVVDALAGGRVAVVRDALCEHVVDALRDEALRREAANVLVPASVGRGNGRVASPAVRGDRIAWLDPEHATPAERAYFDAMEGLRAALNRELMMGAAELEAHYALYPSGAAYARHRDRFRDDDRRVVSVILYLNRDWRDADGGALRVYLDDRETLDVAPQAGTLVAFAADAFDHEVLPATRPRVALTGWLRRRAMPCARS